MVKAKKRKTVAQEIDAKKKKWIKETKKDEPFITRHIREIIIVFLILISIGFIFPQFGPTRTQSTVEDQQQVDYGVGTPSGTQGGVVMETSQYHGVFGQIGFPQDLSQELNGDLYVLGEGSNLLIVTPASVQDINAKAQGNYIIYNLSYCGNFDCLTLPGQEDTTPPENATAQSNQTTLYEVYRVDMPSQMLKTSSVGMPTTQ